MLYCVSFSNGVVGVFSSMEMVEKMVFNRFPSIVFITQVYKHSSNIKSNNGSVWIVMYKDTETCAFTSNDREEAVNAVKVFNTIGKAYEDNIDYWEQDIDVISERVESILGSLQMVYGESGISIDSSKNVVYYV